MTKPSLALRYLPYAKFSTTTFQLPTVATTGTHTMGSSLFKYVQMKVHPDIQKKSWPSILVEGVHARSQPARISSIEKIDKPFNWQRPTSLLLDSKRLKLLCFPGVDYIRHYAALIATYQSLTKRSPDVVRYSLPTEKECMRSILSSNLAKMGPADIVIVGYVHGLDRFIQHGLWEGGGNDELFSWQKLKGPGGSEIAFLGCRVSFWGDIAGNVVRALQILNGTKCVLYVGKLGSLRAEHSPNQWLATGSTSFLHGQTITWNNAFEPFLEHCPPLVRGSHYTLSSVLDETNLWLRECTGKYDFVDPEIGHMAKASVDGGTLFGFLHVISDNLARKYTHDLSNERLMDVIRNRKNLIWEIQEVLSRFFKEWPGR